MGSLRTSVATVLFLSLTACEDPEHLTGPEALEALAQIGLSSRGEEATQEVIEVSTDFTIGAAIQQAADELAEFWNTQAPCSEVTVSDFTVTVDYGELNDSCTYNGHSYSGVNTVEVVSASSGELQVEHTYDQFTNGEVTVNGQAQVVWSGEDLSRTVTTAHTWTDTNGEQVDVVGEHVQVPLENGGWLGGITMTGDRHWTHRGEDWSLVMTDLQMRWQDPAPQSGSVAVLTPKGKNLTVTYSRIDDKTIEAIISGTRDEIILHISPLGQTEIVE